jgi:CRISPR-associated endonuclease Cas1
MIPRLHLLVLRFRVLEPVAHLPHYHGPHWSAMLRCLFRALDPVGGEVPVSVVPVETGINRYYPGDKIHLGVTLEAVHGPALARLVRHFDELPAGKGHFRPGSTICLESALSRLTGKPYDPDEPPFSMEDIGVEAEALSRLDSFTIETVTPLRITRPAGTKTRRHRYCDEIFFRESGTAALMRLMEKVYNAPMPENIASDDVILEDAALTWLDTPYGGPRGKTIGGVVGRLRCRGIGSRPLCECLVLGQYAGTGKNRAFGLGFYTIAELAAHRRPLPLARATTLLRRATGTKNLADALAGLPDASPGPDGMTRSDAIAGGASFLKQLQKQARGPVSEGREPAMKQYLLSTGDNGCRTIHVQNMSDRILHRAWADVLEPVIEALLPAPASGSSLRRLAANGFRQGVEVEQDVFLDFVHSGGLAGILGGLLPAEPLIKQLLPWFAAISAVTGNGLTQNLELSQVLVRLCLGCFTQAVKTADMRFVRHDNQFLILGRDHTPQEEFICRIEKIFSGFDASLVPEKKTLAVQKVSLNLLGMLSSPDARSVQSRSEQIQEEPWLPVFRPEWLHGVPVYLTGSCRKAFSRGENLVVNYGEDKTETIAWNRISRIIVVGRASFTHGVVYRAVREQIPVTFIDVMGRTTGHLLAAGHEKPSLEKLQKEKLEDTNWTLSVSRQLVAAKIHNQYVLLRRNGFRELRLKALRNQAEAATCQETLRGYEGAAAQLYFARFADLVTPFRFKGRCYHPPDGPVNVMLSFGYTLLYNQLVSVIENRGLNPRIGCLHRGRGRHCALASDLIEPLRHLVDRIVLALIHLGEIKPADFPEQEGSENYPCRLQNDCFRTFIRRYEQTLNASFLAPKGEKMKMSYNAWLDETVDDFIRDIRFAIPYQPLRIR